MGGSSLRAGMPVRDFDDNPRVWIMRPFPAFALRAVSCAPLRLSLAIRPGIAALVALSVLAACSGGGGDSVAPPSVTAVVLSSPSIALQGLGTTTSISATIQPSGASGTISWRSDNPGVVSVSSSGASATLTAVAAGTTTVVATAGGVSASATVTVTPLVRGLTLSRTTASIVVGATSAVTATVSADAGASTRVVWSSSATTVATVDSTGVITGVAPGNAVITATSAVNAAVNANVNVTVAYPVVRSVVLTPANPSLLIAGTRQLAATVDVDAGTATSVNWNSETPTVATVSNAGLVTALTPGTTVIRATSTANPTVSGTTTVTVTAPTVRGITLSPTDASVLVGATRQIVPTVDADAGANTTLSWTTNDAAVATVSASGVVSAVAPGSTTVRATSILVPSVFATATITVTGPQVLNAWSRRTLSPFSPPLSVDINDAVITGPSDGFAIFSADVSDGTMLRWDGTAWNASVLAPFGSLSALGAVVGRTFVGSDNGQIAQFTTAVAANPGFIEMSTPAIGRVYRFRGIGSSEAAALVANSGSSAPARGVLLFNGTTWSRLPDPPAHTALLSMDASALNNVVVSGIGGTGLSQWNGSSWTSLPAPPLTGTIASIELVGADLVVVSSNFTSARLSSGVWTPLTMPAIRPNAGGAFVTTLQECGPAVYAGTTFDGRILRLDGTTWTVIADYGAAARGSYTLTPTCGVTGTLRAVGTDAGIGRWTGSDWVTESSSPWFFDISLVSPTLAYAVGGHGQVYRFDGTSWSLDLAVSTFSYMQTITATADGLVLAADIASPTGVWRKQSGTWQFDALPTAMGAVWANSTTFALGLGFSNSFVYTGAGWQASAPLTGFSAGRIDGVSPAFAMAAGTQGGVGAVYKWDGTSWTRMTMPSAAATFVGLRVLSPTLAFAAFGTSVFKWDGTAWTALPSPTTQIGSAPLRAISALSANDVYALTATGMLVRFNGTTWFTQAQFPSTPGVSPYYQALATTDGLGLVVGYGGAIYVGRPGAMMRAR